MPLPALCPRAPLMLALFTLVAVVGCVPAVGPDDAAERGESGEPAVPDLAENRIHPLEGTPEPELPVTVSSVVVDSAGADDAQVEHEDVDVGDVERILPLTGMIAEVVFTLGLGDNVVGRDAAADFAEAADLPQVTEGHDISAESVLALEPTVILADTWTGPPEAMEQLQASGIPVVVLEEAWTFEDMYPRFEQVAEALGVDERGSELVERTEEQMAQVRAQTPQPEGHQPEQGPSVAFLYLRGTAGVYLLGGPGSGADALLEEVGARDAGTEIGLDQPFTPITSEALIEAQPDVILTMTGGLESVGGVDGLSEIPGIAQTPAGQEQRVIDLPDGVLLTFGPRTPQVVAALAEELFPEESAT